MEHKGEANPEMKERGEEVEDLHSLVTYSASNSPTEVGCGQSNGEVNLARAPRLGLGGDGLGRFLGQRLVLHRLLVVSLVDKEQVI